jgi:plasmid stabilization system protein ParE
MKVHISEEADRDLEAIGAYIARDNPNGAARFVHELLAACDSLGEWPSAWPLIPGCEQLGFRRRPYKSHMIVYRVRQDIIEVSRVFHASRDYERLLFPNA